MTNIKKQSFILGLDSLWIAVALAFIAIVVSLATLSPDDFWWHLKVGEWIWTNRAIPHTNLFAWSVPADTPFIFGTWLSDLWLYLLYLVKGLGAIVFVRNILGVILFGLVGYEAKRRTGSWRLGALAALLALLMTLNSLSARPQIFAWIPFMLFLILLGSYANDQIPPKRLYWLPVIMVFWVNIHDSFLLGLFLIAAFLAGEVLEQRWKPKPERSWRMTRWLSAILGLTVLATFLSPNFFRTYEYAFRMMADKTVRTFGMEWQPTTPSGLSNMAFYITFIGLIFLATQVDRFPKPADMILACVLTWLTWTSQRNLIWFALFAAPFFCQDLSWLPIKLPFKTGVKNWVNSLAAVLLFLPAVFFQPGLGDLTGLRARFFQDAPVANDLEISVSKGTPIQAAEYLKAHPGGKLFNNMVYGSYLDWAVPDQKVFVDTRIEQYPYEMWQDYLRISNGIRSIELLDLYGADRILLSKESQGELDFVLSQDPNWKMEYEDNLSEIWVKK